MCLLASWQRSCWAASRARAADPESTPAWLPSARCQASGARLRRGLSPRQCYMDLSGDGTSAHVLCGGDARRSVLCGGACKGLWGLQDILKHVT